MSKILIWDLETMGFGNYKGPAADWGYTLCFGYKWKNKKTVKVLKLSDYKLWKKDPQDDTDLLKDAYEIIMEADELVAHYGDKFDKPWFQTRLLKANLPIMPPTRQVDTCKVAQRHLKLSSNRLGNICQFFGLPNKEDKDWPGWWLRSANGDAKALAAMAKYCAGDIVSLDAVHTKLLPFINHVHRGMLKDNVFGCPKCGSDALHKRGFSYTATSKHQRYYCTECGGWSHEKERKVLGYDEETGKPLKTPILK